MYSYLYISRLGRPSRPPSVFINIETDPRLYSPPLTLVLASPTPFRTSVAIRVTSPARVRTARNSLLLSSSWSVFAGVLSCSAICRFQHRCSIKNTKTGNFIFGSIQMSTIQISTNTHPFAQGAPGVMNPALARMFAFSVRLVFNPLRRAACMASSLIKSQLTRGSLITPMLKYATLECK